jgi:hypothetical protein
MPSKATKNALIIGVEHKHGDELKAETDLSISYSAGKIEEEVEITGGVKKMEGVKDEGKGYEVINIGGTNMEEEIVDRLEWEEN